MSLNTKKIYFKNILYIKKMEKLYNVKISLKKSPVNVHTNLYIRFPGLYRDHIDVINKNDFELVIDECNLFKKLEDKSLGVDIENIKKWEKSRI